MKIQKLAQHFYKFVIQTANKDTLSANFNSLLLHILNSNIQNV